MATAVLPLPLTEGDITIGFIIEGRPTRPGDEPSARVSVVEPEFFETLRLSLKRGRFFRSPELDAKNAPVVIVNEALAHKYFPGKDAVGQHIAPHVGPTDTSPLREIVGIVGDVKRGSLTELAKPEYYMPYEQAPIAGSINSDACQRRSQRLRSYGPGCGYHAGSSLSTACKVTTMTCSEILRNNVFKRF